MKKLSEEPEQNSSSSDQDFWLFVLEKTMARIDKNKVISQL